MKDSQNNLIDQLSNDVSEQFLEIFLNSLDTPNSAMSASDYSALDNLSEKELINLTKLIFEFFDESEENYKLLSSELTARILLKTLAIDQSNAEEISIKSKSISVIATLSSEDSQDSKFTEFFTDQNSQKLLIELLKSSNQETKENTFWAILFILEKTKIPEINFLKDEAIKEFAKYKSELPEELHNYFQPLAEELHNYFQPIAEEQTIIASTNPETPQSHVSLVDTQISEIEENEIFGIDHEDNQSQIDSDSLEDLRDKFKKSSKQIDKEAIKIYEENLRIAELITEISDLKSQVSTKESEITQLKSRISQLENLLQEQNHENSETKNDKPDESMSLTNAQSLSSKAIDMSR